MLQLKPASDTGRHWSVLSGLVRLVILIHKFSKIQLYYVIFLENQNKGEVELKFNICSIYRPKIRKDESAEIWFLLSLIFCFPIVLIQQLSCMHQIKVITNFQWVPQVHVSLRILLLLLVCDFYIYCFIDIKHWVIIATKISDSINSNSCRIRLFNELRT